MSSAQSLPQNRDSSKNSAITAGRTNEHGPSPLMALSGRGSCQRASSRETEPMDPDRQRQEQGVFISIELLGAKISNDCAVSSSLH